MSEKIKLFQTVADIYNRGEIELSASDRAVIEAETQDLISKSMFRRKAEKMPEGFEQILSKLKGMKDVEAQEAFDLVVDFLKDGGILKGKGGPAEKPEKPEIGEKKEKPKSLKDEEEDEGPLH